jgi:hypothetical protein
MLHFKRQAPLSNPERSGSLRRFSWPLLLCLSVAPSWLWAQAPSISTSPFEVIAATRESLRLQQIQLEAECYQRFAVNDCLEARRLNYRAQLNDLKRQENSLKAEQRRTLGALELERLDAHFSSDLLDHEQAHRQQKADANGAHLLELEQSHGADEIAREQARLQRQAQAEARQKQHEQVLSDLRARQADEAKQRAAYQEKREAAAKRQAEQVAKDGDKKGAVAPLLPK